MSPLIFLPSLQTISMVLNTSITRWHWNKHKNAQRKCKSFSFVLKPMTTQQQQCFSWIFNHSSINFQLARLFGFHSLRGGCCAKSTPWYMMPFTSMETTSELSKSARPSSEKIMKTGLEIQSMNVYMDMVWK